MKSNTRKIANALMAIIMVISMMTSLALPASAAVSDVKPSNWAYKAVQFSVENKLIAVSHSAYKANNPAPRKDVTYALYKLLNGKDNEPTDIGTTIAVDTTKLSGAYKYSVQWCIENNIIAGTKSSGDKIWFSPEMIITREQMATILYRTAEYLELNTYNSGLGSLNRFTDKNKISGWAKEAVAWCVNNNLLNGTSKTTMSPRSTLTFAQLAQVMMNFNDLMVAQLTPVEPDPTPTPTVEPTATPAPTPTPVVTNGGSYYNQTAHPENANSTDWLETYVVTDLSGPWDNVPEFTGLPEGGYMKNNKRYNKYGVCIEDVKGIPNDEEKKAFIMINQHRLNNGLEPLKWDQSQQVIAETRAIESCKEHTNNSSEWGHVRPNGDDKNQIAMEWRIGKLTTQQYYYWIQENAYPRVMEYITATHPWYGVPFENGVKTYQIVKGWIESPSHNGALLGSIVSNGTDGKYNINYGAVAFSCLEDRDTEEVMLDEQANFKITYRYNYWYFNGMLIYE